MWNCHTCNRLTILYSRVDLPHGGVWFYPFYVWYQSPLDETYVLVWILCVHCLRFFFLLQTKHFLSLLKTPFCLIHFRPLFWEILFHENKIKKNTCSDSSGIMLKWAASRLAKKTYATKKELAIIWYNIDYNWMRWIKKCSRKVWTIHTHSMVLQSFWMPTLNASIFSYVIRSTQNHMPHIIIEVISFNGIRGTLYWKNSCIVHSIFMHVQIDKSSWQTK